MLPGLELTYDHDDPHLAAHAVALGLQSFVGVQAGLEVALASARAFGAALVAAHPYAPDQLEGASRGTAAFAASPELAVQVDRFELFNRHNAVRLGRRGRPTSSASTSRARSARRRTRPRVSQVWRRAGARH